MTSNSNTTTSPVSTTSTHTTTKCAPTPLHTHATHPTSSLPSLLMQAAHSAAVADGLVPATKKKVNSNSGSINNTNNNKHHNNGLNGNRGNINLGGAKPAVISTSSTSTSNTNTNSNNNSNNDNNNTTSSTSASAPTTAASNSSSAPQPPKSLKAVDGGSDTNRSAVEAALAMVAVGNSKATKQNLVTPNTSNTNTGANENGTRTTALGNNAGHSVNNNNNIQMLKNRLSSNGSSAVTSPVSSSQSQSTSAQIKIEDQQQQQQRSSTSNTLPKSINVSTNVQHTTSAGSAAHMLAVAAATHGKPAKPTTSLPLSSSSSSSATTKNKIAMKISPSSPLPPTSNNNTNINANTNVRTIPSTSKSSSKSIQKPTTLAPPAPPTTQSKNNSNSGNSSPAPRSTSASSSTATSTGKKKSPALRRGKWTPEEEAYANRLILEFKAGLLPLTDGTTLRTFLSKLLNCDPMRISKKFVGSNCIGKQVFRRRTADINRLTPDQIQQSRAELSELERRFLERVAQTNRVKSSGVGNNSGGGNTQATASVAEVSKVKQDEIDQSAPPSPPWLQPPNGFKHGTGAATAANTLSSGTVNRTALIGRALLQGNSSLKKNSSKPSLSSSGSAGLLALMELQRRQSQQNLLAQSLGNSTNSLLAAAAAQNNGNNSNTNNNNSLSGPALAQIARNASAARMAGLAASGNSMSNLMMKTGLSRDQLSQLVKERHNSSNSLTNMMGRQSSLDALMSLDFQSLQSIDNLANLIQTGANPSRVPKSGMKNWSSDGNTSTSSLAAVAASLNNSNNNVSNLVNLRRLASEGRMESLIRSLSSGNVANKGNNSGGSNANFNDILQSMQNNLNGEGNNSASNLFGQAASALNLANMLRTNSSTGLTALRMQDGLAQRNTSVDDFLSLVASGDIPHQDPHMLNVPLQTVLQQQQNQSSGASAAAQYLAHQQLLAQAANNSNSSLSQRIASLGGLTGNTSVASLLSQYTQQQQRGPNNDSNTAAAVLAHQQQHQARALAAAAQQNTANALETLKRKFSLSDMVNGADTQGPSKR